MSLSPQTILAVPTGIEQCCGWVVEDQRRAGAGPGGFIFTRSSFKGAGDRR